MDNTLEQKTLGYLLNNFELLNRVEIKEDWFSDLKHRELAHTLLETKKEYADMSEVMADIREIYPHTQVTEEWLQAVKFEYIYVNDFKASLKTLKEEYVRKKALEASQQYSAYPTKANRENLENWFRKINELNIDENMGELRQPIDQLLYELDNEVEQGLKSYKGLDQILGAGLENGMLFVLAGRPGTGKTAYAMNIGIEALKKRPDTQIDFFSLEMSDEEMLKRFVARLTSINSYKFKNSKTTLTLKEKKQVIQQADWLNKTGLRIHDDKFRLSEIERTIRQRKYENPDKKYLAIIDYVGLVDAEEAKAQEYQQIGKISRTLKRTANELGAPILLLSQLNRAVESRQTKKPNLSDLRSSGDLEQDANVVGLLWEHPEVDNVINLEIAKNRNGMISTLHYDFYKPSLTFTETEVGNYEN